MRALLFAATIVTAVALAAPSEAQEFTLRAGADVRPLVGYDTVGGNGISIGDVGWLGIHVVPGLKLAQVFTLELGLEPLIPIVGDGTKFIFLVSPGIYLDLQLFYVRAAVPIALQSELSVFFEGAAGLSFLGHGYLGAVLDYDTSGFLMLGAEVGYKF